MIFSTLRATIPRVFPPRLHPLSLKSYFVRRSEDREVIGFFIASSTVMLASLVDECCDPSSCEFAAAQMGGLMVLEKTKAKWPFERPQSKPTTGLAKAVLTQQWEDDLHRETSVLEWKSLKPASRRMLQSLAKA